MEAESPFSLVVPQLQVAIDSTSLGEFKTCPRKYQLSILEGWQRRIESVHLTFGLLIHRASEIYHHLKFEGADHEEALKGVVSWGLKKTFNSTAGKPWNSDDPQKNRFTFIRSIIWYFDHFKDDPFKTILLNNGKPAVELSFQFDSTFSYSTAEPIRICGHLDRLATFSDYTFISDIKTTKNTISKSWFDKFTPDNQFSTYSLAGKIFYKVETQGLIVDGWQVSVNFTKFERQIIERNPYQLDRWWKELPFWFSQMERCATDQYWPQNDKSCNLFGGCQFRGVCSAKSKQSADLILSQDFVQRNPRWNPLQHRSDI